MAEAIFRNMVNDKGLADQIMMDSAGLGDWHIGDAPHRGTREILDLHGIPYDSIYSRQIQATDIDEFTYIVAMDEDNIKGLKKLGAVSDTKVFRLLDLIPDEQDKNIPDPYFTGNFEEVYRLVLAGCQRLLATIVANHSLVPKAEPKGGSATD